MSIQYQIPRNLIEVYKTDEENFEAYTPNSENSEDTSKSEEIETDEEEDKEGFTLHQGEIIETYYCVNLLSTDTEYDYEDINNNGSLTLTSVDKKRFYKGVRILHRKGWEKPGETLNLEELPENLLGFITEQTYHEDGVDLKISGMTKLLEKKYQFDFSQMKISEILVEMIKTAGLIPVVNPEGLDDRVIDYSNVSGGEGGSAGSTDGIDGDVVKLAKKICKGKKGAKAKANAICNYIATNIQYGPRYENHRHCPKEVLTSFRHNCNCCDRARLGYQMGKVVGLECRGVHGPGHVWVEYKIDGKWVDSDPGVSRKSIGSTWKNMSMDSLWNFPDC